MHIPPDQDPSFRLKYSQRLGLDSTIPGFRKPRQLGLMESFGICAVSPAIAVLFTNPFDTIVKDVYLSQKVRLQLQDRTKETVYRNSFDAFRKIWDREGLRGLQKGLQPAILREASKNLFRIGLFEPILRFMHDPELGSAPAYKRMFAGSLCGVLGAIACNPFELIKTRLQSGSPGNISVGHQHNYRNVWHGWKSIYVKEGFSGLYRGSQLSMLRSFVGSGANLASYSLLKEHLIVEKKWTDSWKVDMVAGLASGVASCICMNPIDVVRTRYYNQPSNDGGMIPNSTGMTLFSSILRSEGPLAFYKGFSSHFLRIGPHFCCTINLTQVTFVFLGLIRRQIESTYKRLDSRDLYEQFDSNNDGFLGQDKVRMILQNMSNDPLEDHDLICLYADRIWERAGLLKHEFMLASQFPLLERELRVILDDRAKGGLNCNL